MREKVMIFPDGIDFGVSWSGAVLFEADEVEGLLLLGAKHNGRVYSDKDGRVLLTVASWVAGGLANRRLLDLKAISERDETRLLIEHEENIRGEIAGELHDQGITPLGYVKMLLHQDDPKEVVLAAIDRVLQDLRRITSERLFPSGLDFGVVGALSVLGEQLSAMGQVVEVEVDSSYSEAWGKVGSAVGREVYYVVREAVSNAVKYGRPPVKVLVGGEGQLLRVEISDCGTGIDTVSDKQRVGQRHGLRIMHARTNRIGGNLNISSASTGTVVVLHFPGSEANGQ